MDLAPGVLPLLKVLAAFFAMLLGIRLRLGLGLSILLGAAALGLFFTTPPLVWLRAAGGVLAEPGTLYLAAIVGLILILSDLMESTGQARRLMDSLAGYLASPRLRLAFFPALIGLLPMPGGAVFSAPMVAGVAEPLDLSREHKALINYWFRHLWEMSWPLYPGLIMTANLSGVPITRLVLYTAPGSLVCLALGWWFLLRPKALRLTPPPDAALPPRAPWAALREGLPLVIAIAGGLGLEAAIDAFAPDAAFELGVIAALAGAVACVALQNRSRPGLLLASLARKSFWSMVLVITSTYVFKAELEAAGAVEQMSALAGGPAALLVAGVFLPLLVGFIAGINVAFVGSTFPLLLGLLPLLGLQEQMIPCIVLGTFAGFTGVMASPLHICFMLTCQYFGADLAPSWRRILMPCALLLASGCAYSWMLSRLLS